MGTFMHLPASLVKPLATMLFGTQVQLAYFITDSHLTQKAPSSYKLH